MGSKSGENEFSGKKRKRHSLTFPNTKLHAKNQKYNVIHQLVIRNLYVCNFLQALEFACLREKPDDEPELLILLKRGENELDIKEDDAVAELMKIRGYNAFFEKKAN